MWRCGSSHPQLYLSPALKLTSTIVSLSVSLNQEQSLFLLTKSSVRAGFLYIDGFPLFPLFGGIDMHTDTYMHIRTCTCKHTHTHTSFETISMQSRSEKPVLAPGLTAGPQSDGAIEKQFYPFLLFSFPCFFCLLSWKNNYFFFIFFLLLLLFFLFFFSLQR